MTLETDDSYELGGEYLSQETVSEIRKMHKKIMEFATNECKDDFDRLSRESCVVITMALSFAYSDMRSVTLNDNFFTENDITIN